MTTLLQIDSSSRDAGSHSRAVAQTFRSEWQAANPAGTVTALDLAEAPVPHLIAAVRALGTPVPDRTAEEQEALALQARVVEEFVAADAYLISLPMYNWGIPSQLKAYLDHLLVVGVTMPTDGSPSPVAGRRATVVVSFGGGYAPGTPRGDWDFVRPYLTKVLVETLGLEVEFVAVELTLASTVPAMAELVPLAEKSREAAHEKAVELARASRLRIAS